WPRSLAGSKTVTTADRIFAAVSSLASRSANAAAAGCAETVNRALAASVSGGGAGSSRRLIRRLWFDHRLLVVQEDRLGANGEVDAMIQYDDFRSLDDGGIVPAQMIVDQDRRMLRPFKISLEDGRGQGTIHVTFHELQHNQTIKTEDLGQAS
ncbi:MAG: hypothetical protein HC938_05090, partial [Nitrospira sp.]|nr:hypothetical protein [Nitrospira sp.]